MSYLSLQSNICADAQGALQRRIDALDRQLQNLAHQHGGPAPALTDVSCELCYLQKLVATIPAGDRSRGLYEGRLGDLRELAGQLPQRAPGETPGCASASSTAPAGPATAGAAQAAGDQRGEDPSVSALATFMMPKEPAADGEDAVRLLASEGKLAATLEKYPKIVLPGAEASFAVNSWKPEDDQESDRRMNCAILDVKEGVATLLSFQKVINRQAVADQERFDQLEQQMADTRERVREGAQVLALAAGRDNDIGMTLVDSTLFLIGSIILGAGVVAASATGGGVALLPVLGKTGLELGAVTATRCGAKGLSNYQAETLKALARQIPEATAPVSPSDRDELQRAGDRAERRLLADIGDASRWSACWSNRGRGLVVRSRPSGPREGGLAYSASFNVGAPADNVFEALQQSGLSGSLDPGCEIVWSRPLEDMEGTSLRYLVFSTCASVRAFYCACRQAKVESKGQFVFALGHLDPELGAKYGLPAPGAVKRGAMDLFGVAVTGLDGGSSRVDVVADIDVSLTMTPTSMIDRHVRHHVIDISWRFLETLERRGVHQVANHGGNARN